MATKAAKQEVEATEASIIDKVHAKLKEQFPDNLDLIDGVIGAFSTEFDQLIASEPENVNPADTDLASSAVIVPLVRDKDVPYILEGSIIEPERYVREFVIGFDEDHAYRQDKISSRAIAQAVRATTAAALGGDTYDNLPKFRNGMTGAEVSRTLVVRITIE